MCAIMKIGEQIKKVLFEQGKSAKWLSEQINCERTNVYNIFGRDDININLLRKISVILDYDFFRGLSEDTFGVRRKRNRMKKNV